MQENNNLNWGKPLFYGFLVILGILIGVFFKGNFNLGSLTRNNQQPIQEMIELVGCDNFAQANAGTPNIGMILGQFPGRD